MRNVINLLLICSCASAAFAREEYTREFRKTVAMPAGKTFRIEHSLGNVNVRTQGKAEAGIQASIHCTAPNAGEARSCADRIQILVEETATQVWVRTQYPEQGRFEGLRGISYSVNYEVALPETAPLELRNRFGSVSVANLHAAGVINNTNGKVTFANGRGRQGIDNAFGDVDVLANDGEVTVVNTNGQVTASGVTGALDIRDRFGNVRVTNAGKGVAINSGNGSVEVANVAGAAIITNSFGEVTVKDAKSDVTVHNQNGRVEAWGVAGTAELHTSFSPVRFSRIGKTLTVRATNADVTGDTVGDSATVETSFGSVDLRGVKGSARATAGNASIRLANISGEVFAKTSFAGVTVDDAAGPITVENGNGSIVVAAKAAPRCQPVSLHTSFGPIRVTVPRGVGYNVSAKTSFGRIQSQPELAVSGQVGSDSVTGKIAGGGCELRLMNQNGDINILH